MLTTVFSLYGNNDKELEDQYKAIRLNVKLIRRLDSKRHVSLLVKSTEGLDNLDEFDRVYELDWGTNHISFLARTLPTVEADQVLYLTPRIFCMDTLSRAFERNLSSSVFFPGNVLDFRGCIIDASETWQEQQVFSKHQWPVVSPKLMLFNNDIIYHLIYFIFFSNFNIWYSKIYSKIFT